MSSACRRSYTPAEMIAILSIAFVDGNLPPSIDANGSPVYRIVDGSGCALMTIAQVVGSDLVRTLQSAGRHADCSVGQLGTSLADLLDVPAQWMRLYDPSGTSAPGLRERIALGFFISLQNMHDIAARFYDEMVTHGVPGDTALPAFRRRVARILVDIGRAWQIPADDVGNAKARLSGVVTKAIPAAARKRRRATVKS